MWLTKLLHSFRFALEGLKYTLVTQRNMRIHFLTALGVLLLSLLLPLSKTEVLLLFVTIVLVLVTELFNTVVEAVVDMITKDFHPLAKVAKDVAAGAVLLSAGLAVVVGVSIFYPYLDLLKFPYIEEGPVPPNIKMVAILVSDFFLTLLLKSWFHRKGRPQWEPSMTTSIAFCIATSVALMIRHLLIALLVYLLTAILVGTRLRIKTRRSPVIVGALLGTVVALIGFILL